MIWVCLKYYLIIARENITMVQRFLWELLLVIPLIKGFRGGHPSYAVIPVNDRNARGYPTVEVLKRLKKQRD